MYLQNRLTDVESEFMVAGCGGGRMGGGDS